MAQITETARKDPPPVFLSSSPHFASPVNSRQLMGNMLIALTPVSIYGVLIFGLPALLNIVVSVAAAILGEALFRLITRQGPRISDLSAGVTGLLLALIVPPATPPWMTALGAVFAVVVAKEFFGGLGANVFNPALIGRAFLLMSFPAALTTWHFPQGRFITKFTAAMGNPALVDGVSGVTPLNIIKNGSGTAGIGKVFAAANLSSSDGYWSTIQTLFTGNHAGSIGESSIFLILAALIFLLVTKTIDWRAPVGMIAAGALASWVLGKLPGVRMDPLVGVLGGGLVFGAVFMATDYVTAPLTAKGKLIFGFGAGLITILIRKWGSYPEGVTYGILIMNGLSPFLNRLLPKKYGFVPKKKVAAKTGERKGAAV
ncbi:MAG: RnfABCDGE type electron transport complex subunit D [Treponema sp.]|jgi:electron transport complex protein RnfD|nr:RnfABCDGE type electron transport complex subunit D [Treponema sp.]